MQRINGIALNDAQVKYYRGLSAKNPAMAKRFLTDIRKKQDREKDVSQDRVLALRKEAVDIAELAELDNRGVHNFSIGCLDAYFYLSEQIEAGKAFLYRGRVLVMSSRTGGWKTFVFEYHQEDLSALQMLQAEGVVYSLVPIPGLPKQSKFQEMAYNIETVFDPASYPNTKKRKNKIRHPLTYINNSGFIIEPVSQDNLAECEVLHDRWVEHKLADERTFQIMFPRRRYMRCAEKAAMGFLEGFGGVSYEGRAFRLEGKIVGVNIMSVEKGRGYGLAMFGNIWDPQFNRLMGATDLWYLKKFLDEGVLYYNAGTTVNSDHKSYKERYPHFIVESFMYSRIK